MIFSVPLNANIFAGGKRRYFKILNNDNTHQQNLKNFLRQACAVSFLYNSRTLNLTAYSVFAELFAFSR